MANKVVWFVLGGVVGAVTALLCAPRAGAETRAMVAEKAQEAWGQAQEFGGQVSQNAQQIYQQATAKGQEVFAKGQAAAQQAMAKGQQIYQNATSKISDAAGNIKPVFAESNDQLRDKIEAARQRIASQVMKNAQEAETKADAIPTNAEEPASTDGAAPAQS